MASRKIEIDENDLKKVILLLTLSSKYVQIPQDNLTMRNMWRISEKLVGKLLKKAGLILLTNKGRTIFKSIEEVNSEVVKEDISAEENPEEMLKSDDTSEVSVEKPVDKVPRCRKRKK